jgi:hypothetical protein
MGVRFTVQELLKSLTDVELGNLLRIFETVTFTETFTPEMRRRYVENYVRNVHAVDVD